MTRKLLVLLFVFFLFVFVSPVNAEDTATAGAQRVTDSTAKPREQERLLREQKRAAFTQVKNEIKAKIQTEREEYKLKIQTIKDQKKKALTERIDAKLAEINTKHTGKFLEILNKLQTILDRIAAGSSSSAEIAISQTAIDAAKSMNEIQAVKTYTMTIVDDATLKLNAGTTVSQLRQDLSNVHKLVVDAKQAVQKFNTDKKAIRNEASSSAR